MNEVFSDINSDQYDDSDVMLPACRFVFEMCPKHVRAVTTGSALYKLTVFTVCTIVGLLMTHLNAMTSTQQDSALNSVRC